MPLGEANDAIPDRIIFVLSKDWPYPTALGRRSQKDQPCDLGEGLPWRLNSTMWAIIQSTLPISQGPVGVRVGTTLCLSSRTTARRRYDSMREDDQQLCVRTGILPDSAFFMCFLTEFILHCFPCNIL